MSNGKEGSDTTTARFYHRLRKEATYRSKFLRTIWICFSFIMLGWVESLFGPTFPDLRKIINKDLDTSSWLFTGTSGGFLVGSVLTGLLYGKFNKDLMIGAAILGTAAAITAIPWCRLFYLMLIVKIVAGLLAASFETGGNAQVVSMWKKESGPYMQAVHFCFSLGGMIAPLVAQPFLASQTCVAKPENNSTFLNEMDNSKANNFSKGGFNLSISHSYNVTDCVNIYEVTRVHYAYLISGILTGLTSLPFFITLFLPSTSDETREERLLAKDDKNGFGRLPLFMKLLILAQLSLLMILYCGTEDTFAGFLMTFLISQLNWTKTEGALATSLYWICFGVARLGGIIIVKLLRTSTLMYIYSSLLTVSFTCLLTSTVFKLQPMIWISIGMVGFSLSILFASIFTWTTECVTQVEGKLSAMFMASASLGVTLFPLLFGYTMKWLSPMWFVYLLLGQSVVWIILFTAANLSIRILLNRVSSEVRSPEKEPLNLT